MPIETTRPPSRLFPLAPGKFALKKCPVRADTRPMPRSGRVETIHRIPAPVAVRHYVERRSALELLLFDGLVVAFGMLIALPRALTLDWFWVQMLVASSPGLLLVARSLVIAAHVPGVFTLAQLDPQVDTGIDRRLEDARHQAWLGILVLALTGLLAAAVAATVGLGIALSQLAS